MAARQGFVPFVDIAYQGFATDLDSDAFLIRELAGRVPAGQSNIQKIADRCRRQVLKTAALCNPAFQVELWFVSLGVM